MANKVLVTKQKVYSFWIGLQKTAKNCLIIFGPTLVATLSGVSGKYAWLAGGAAYMIKNYLENK